MGTLEILREFLFTHVKKLGLQIVADQKTVKDSITFVQKVLDLKGKYDRIISESFKGDKKAQMRLKEAFGEFLNKDSKSAFYLAAFIDDMFRSGLRQRSDVEMEQMLDRVILIFQHIRDKDLFENYYRTHLAKRLLGGLSFADELEETMIRKLKQESGYHFVSKLEGMLHDMGNSRVHMEQFRETATFNDSPVEIKVDVLTRGFWSTGNHSQCKLPMVVLERRDAFAAFFLEKHQGQKLLWQNYLGSADIRAAFPKRTEGV